MGTVSGAPIAVGLSMIVILSVACGGRQPASEQAELRVRVVPETASVYIDDRFVASGRRLAARPERMRPGVHFVTVSAPGYFPHDVRVDLPVGETTIELELRPVPP